MIGSRHLFLLWAENMRRTDFTRSFKSGLLQLLICRLVTTCWNNLHVDDMINFIILIICNTARDVEAMVGYRDLYQPERNREKNLYPQFTVNMFNTVINLIKDIVMLMLCLHIIDSNIFFLSLSLFLFCSNYLSVSISMFWLILYTIKKVTAFVCRSFFVTYLFLPFPGRPNPNHCLLIFEWTYTEYSSRTDCGTSFCQILSLISSTVASLTILSLYANIFVFIDCENNQLPNKWITIAIWNLYSGTKFLGWLRHCWSNIISSALDYRAVKNLNPPGANITIINYIYDSYVILNALFGLA